MNNMPRKNIVFDVGRVLIDFSFNPFVDFVNEHVNRQLSEEEFSKFVKVSDYEEGKLSTFDFLDNIYNFLNSNSDIRHPLELKEEIKKRWQEIFSPIDEMLEYARKVKENHSVFLLSNTSELHWDYLEENYSLLSYSHSYVASYQVKCLKPNIQIYKIAEEKFKLNLSNTIFIDDKLENILGAREAKWNAIQYTNPAEVKSKIDEFIDN